MTVAGVKLYAPILIKSGFGSPINVGPLLEKSTTWSEYFVEFPNLGSSLNGPYPTKMLFVVAPTLIPRGDAFGKPIVP